MLNEIIVQIADFFHAERLLNRLVTIVVIWMVLYAVVSLLSGAVTMIRNQKGRQ